MSLIGLLGAVLASLLASLCAAADGALLSLDPVEPLPPRISALRMRRERVHRALAFARVAAHLGTGLGIALVFTRLELHGWRLGGAIVATALVLVGLTESTARSMGDSRSTGTLLRLSRLVTGVEGLLMPVVTLGEWLDRGLHMLLPLPAVDEEEREAIAEQFKQVVAAEAEVSADQQVLLNGVFRLAQAEVHEIMVPRVDMVAVDETTSWSEVVDQVRAAEHSRLPVFRETIDNIVGILYAKDILPHVLAGSEPPNGWLKLTRPAVLIPRSKVADQQLRDFQATHTHLAIVVDEFGGTAGMITIEDVLEEIVGDIRDEYDVDERPVEHLDANRIRVSARLTLNELSDLLGHDFERDDISTVGGLVYEQFGRAPRAGETCNIAGFHVVVERVERRRVQRVIFRRPTESEDRDA